MRGLTCSSVVRGLAVALLQALLNALRHLAVLLGVLAPAVGDGEVLPVVPPVIGAHAGPLFHGQGMS